MTLSNVPVLGPLSRDIGKMYKTVYNRAKVYFQSEGKERR